MHLPREVGGGQGVLPLCQSHRYIFKVQKKNMKNWIIASGSQSRRFTKYVGSFSGDLRRSHHVEGRSILSDRNK